MICAIPYKGFEKRRTNAWQKIYHDVLRGADEIVTFYPVFQYCSFEERNHFMVEQSVRIIAVFNGERGGTYNTLAYAKRRGLELRILQG